MSNVSSTELFSVNYPITVTLAGGTDATVNSDAELQSNINASLTTQATITQAEENSKKLETILVDGRFKVQSFITAGVDSANNYKDSTVDFAND
jgi:predicted RNA-binding protein associated with RNAse of E/G family